MAGERLDVSRLLPSYESWSNFITLHNGELPIFDIYDNEVNPKHTTSGGVINSVTFYNAKLMESIDLRPYKLSQAYVEPGGKFRFESFVKNESLYGELVLPQPTNSLDSVSVVSESDFIDGEWNNEETVFMALNDGYLAKLKAEHVVPETAQSRVWITWKNGQITQEIEGAIMKPNFPINDDVLRQICSESGLEYEIDVKEGVIKVKLGTTSFELGHIRPTSLDPETIWNALTGSKPERPFIFPLQIIKQEQVQPEEK